MCTVVCRWSPGTAVHVLAVRDEFVGRDFDDPAAWWPDRPDVIGGRDRTAGGTWCACDVRTGHVAVVLNRPDRLVAEPGAASRGVLPLLAIDHGAAWAEYIDVTPMASFNLMLATPRTLSWWTFDGTTVEHTALGPGVHMAKPRGLATGPLGADLVDPDRWRAVLAASSPQTDPSGLLVRIERGTQVYASVFAQLITAAPGAVTIEHSRTPQASATFERHEWRAD